MFENFFDINKNSLITSLQKLIQIESVEDESTDGMPFGKGVDDALKFALNIGNKLGFHTVYRDGYYGYIEMGQGEELIGILAHLDVVPAENPETWIYPPFSGNIANNRIYGRGAIDDKGPLIAALYAMKAVKDSKIPLNKRVRLILGTNEETHWQGIKKYIEDEEIPAYGFTPDSDFPLIHSEKGLLQVKVSTNTHDSSFILRGGDALNSVPHNCTYIGNMVKKLAINANAMDFASETKEDAITLLGKAAHSAKGWEGINAIVRAAILLSRENISSPLIRFIVNEVGEDIYARNLFGNYYDKVSGKLTFNIAKITIDANFHEFFVDIRIPATKEKEEVLKMLQNSLDKYELDMEVLDFLPSLYVPIDHSLITTLRQVYEDKTQQNSTPLSTGGATYARAFENFVAFGPLFPGQEKLAHKKDEFIDIDHLIRCADIYAEAIARLAK